MKFFPALSLWGLTALPSQQLTLNVSTNTDTKQTEFSH